MTGRPEPGVGVLFNPALIDFVQTHASALDHLAVIPDRCWSDAGPGSDHRFEELPAAVAVIERAMGHRTLAMHCIGLSICSAEVFDLPYIDHLAAWQRRFRCEWVSEHLSFTRVGAGHEVNASMALPIPYDDEVLELLVPRVQEIQARLGCPFLLENNVYYVDFPEQEMSEAEFLNRLMQRTGCGLLLDLHNVYTNAVNHGFDACRFLRSLDLDRVVEIHVAGGEPMMGFHTDSHTGPVTEGVWQLLECVAPHTNSLRGVTFEFHESSWPMLHDAGVLAQLARARSVLREYRAARRQVA
jgi:uncharacterized protein (UPF0276 family)